ncbi:MAG: VanZ family protein [Saprospiraceae bacterium]|nr:VanZ family protein [Candidatus Opimibacter skivensis]
MSLAATSPFIRWLPPVLWGLVIFVLSLMPGGQGNMLLFGIPHFDKVGHFGMYAIWAFLIFMALCGYPLISQTKAFWISVLLGAITGVALEYGQYFMHQGRSFELADMIANAFGAVIGSVSGFLYFSRKNK